MSSNNSVEKIQADLQKAINYIKTDLADVVGTLAVAHFKENFDREGFDGNKWAARTSKRKGSTNNQKVLSKSGDLKNSIGYRKNGTGVVIHSDVVYAQVHNEGGTINMPARQTIVAHKEYKRGKHAGKKLFAKNNEKASFAQKASVGAYAIKMPKRQFIGDSKDLDKEIETKITTDLSAILNS